MDILKLDRYFIFLSVFIIFSCKESISKTYSDKDCETYVSAKTGFWIEINSKNITKEEITFSTIDNKKIYPKKIISSSNRISYFINNPIKLSDTINVFYKEKKYALYDYVNITEVAIDGSNHKKINICRISTARINDKKIKDSGNNILKIIL